MIITICLMILLKNCVGHWHLSHSQGTAVISWRNILFKEDWSPSINKLKYLRRITISQCLTMPLALLWCWGTMVLFTMVQSLEQPSVIDQMGGLMMWHSSPPLVDLSFVVFLLLCVQSCLDGKIACTSACNFCMRHDCFLGWETFCAQEALVRHQDPSATDYSNGRLPGVSP